MDKEFKLFIGKMAKVAIGEMSADEFVKSEEERESAISDPRKLEMLNFMDKAMEDIEGRRTLKAAMEEAVVQCQRKRMEAIENNNTEDEKKYDDMIELWRFGVSFLNTIC
jgi:hypothetical protein